MHGVLMQKKRITRSIGRPPSPDGPMVGRNIHMSAAFWDRVAERAPVMDDGRPNVAAKIRQYVRDGMEREDSSSDDALEAAAMAQYRAKFLTRAPAGPWDEALEHAGEYVFSADDSEYFRLSDGDTVVGVLGQSLEGRRIYDGDLLICEPVTDKRRPRHGQIVLVQVHDGDGNYTSTLKVWAGMDNGDVPKLTDGEGQPWPLPDGTVEAKPVAVAKGFLARL